MNNMTNNELVEAVAREVMGYKIIRWIDNELHVLVGNMESTRFFDPLGSWEDMFMVLSKFGFWKIGVTEFGIQCVIEAGNDSYHSAEIYTTKTQELNELPRYAISTALMAHRRVQ